jgi:cell division protein FtsB
MNTWELVYKVAWVFMAILCVVWVACMFIPKIKQIGDRQAKKADLQEQVGRMESNFKDLRDKQERFTTDPAFVEKTARENGMVKTNEMLFKFTNRQINVEGALEQ